MLQRVQRTLRRRERLLHVRELLQHQAEQALATVLNQEEGLRQERTTFQNAEERSRAVMLRQLDPSEAVQSAVITTYADENETVSSVQEGATTAGEVTTEQVTISPETTSLIDDADFRALLQQLEQEIRQAKREGSITGRQWAQLHRPLEQAQQHLRQYDHAVKNGKQRDAEKHLRRYHQALDQLLEQLLGEWRQTAQKIKAYSPPLATH